MRYLVVEAHPDDLVFFCGGTVAKLIDEGHEIEVVSVTDGQQGTLDLSFQDEDLLAEVIRAEDQACCRALGLDPSKVTYMGWKNHFLEPTHQLREEITRIIRRVQPQAIFTFDPWNYDENPDHRAVGLATLEAAAYAHYHLFHPEHLRAGLKVADVAKMVLFKSAMPNTYVDVTTTLGRVIEAALCYKSQVEAMKEEGRRRLAVLGLSHAVFDGDFEQAVRVSMYGMAQATGKKAGMEAAEAFNVRGLGILENIKEVIGGLGV